MISDFDILQALQTSRGQPELAFVYLERKLRDTLNDRLRSLDREDGFDISNSYYIEYINHTIAAAKGLGLDILQNWKLPSHNQYQNISDIYRDFTADVDHYSFQMRLTHARHQEQYSVALDASEKRKIRHYVEQIKTIIEDSNLDTKKKEALFDQINAFLKELDRDRTRQEVFSDLFISIAHTFGEATKELEPIRGFIDSIARVLGYGKEREDSAPKLPPARTKQIEGPKREDPPKGSGRRTTDDEIPF
jgi:hypothetical protein